MPRAAKRNANQHNSRHENGIVAPGKRITKQKSNGHLNGASDGRSRANTPPLPAPSNLQATAPGSEVASNGTSSSVKVHANGGLRFADGDKDLTEVISNHWEELENASSTTDKLNDQHHRKIDVSSVKPASAYEHSGMHLAFTVLKSCPRSDTLAILIFLLSLPPTFLTLTNAIFALLTFIPPSGTFLSIPTLTDIFQNNTLAVSFTTMCIIDLLGMFTWLLPTWTQGMILDWAQAMVASTLGGGYSNQPGGSDNTLVFMGIVSVAHLRHHRRFIFRLFHRTWIAQWVPLMMSPADVPVFPADSITPGQPMIRNVGSVIALHIVAQGVARLIRRWVKSYNESGKPVPSGKVLDPEAVVASQTGGELSGLAEPVLPLNTPIELRSKSSLQSLRDGRDKISSGKRKRKQGNLVRSQQPLWAAFAATKATVMREYEQSQATTDALGSNATDAENLGSAPFVLEEGRAWVTLVRQYDFFFDTSYFLTRTTSEHVDTNGSDWIDDTGIDRSSPIYVRVNGAEWASVKIQAVREENEDDQVGQRWSGEVYGLSPASTYQVAFVRCEDDVVIYSENIVTSSSPSNDQASQALATPPQTIRPSSPTSPSTTLKTSISALEASINDGSALQRRIRKDAKASLATIRKDLDLINDRMAKLGSNDRGLQSRQTQQTQHIRQADDAMTNISSELEAYDKLPEDDSVEWRQAKSDFDYDRNDQSSSRQALFRTKEANHRDDTNLQTEALTMSQKRERLQHRITKLSDQYSRLQSSTDHDTTEKERQNSLHTAKIAERTQIAAHYEEQIASLGRSFSEFRARSSNAWSQNQALEASFEQQSLMASHSPITNSRPITPEGDLPGTIPTSTNTATFRFPPYGSPESLVQGATNGHVASLRHDSGRARSASILSGHSIYAECRDQDGTTNVSGMPVRSMVGNVREGSSSSGGGSPGLRKGGGGSPLVG